MIDQILSRLEGVKKRGPQGYMAKCPSHDDRSPSLALTELSDGRILIKCFAGCGASDVLSSIGLDMGALFPGGKLGEFRGFQRIEENIQQKQTAKNFKDEVILQMAQDMRDKGLRLSQQDLKTERQAFERMRNANTK